MGGWAQRLEQAQALRAQALSIRRRRIVEAREGMRVRVEGRWLWDFCSNDTLGLATEALPLRPDLGFGSRASALVSGFHAEQAALEEEAAAWLGVERVLYVGSGYQANLLALQALLTTGDLCVQDRLNHACLVDGARASGAVLKRYPHADLDGARRQLRTAVPGLRLLATDAVFSMDGDAAPLRELAVLAARRDALLLVDEAHSIGAIGPEGRGLCAALGLGDVTTLLRSLPLGKAFGGSGALLAGCADLIDHLLQWGRPYVYSTAPPPVLAAALREQLNRVRGAEDRRAVLAQASNLNISGRCSHRSHQAQSCRCQKKLLEQFHGPHTNRGDETRCLIRDDHGSATRHTAPLCHKEQ